MRKLPRIATHKFFDFTLKNMTWRAYLISFTVQYCFLFRFVCIELVSLVWFLQIWVAIYVYGTMINWSTLIKTLMQTYIVIVSGSILNVSIVHLNGIWHLIWRYLSKPVLSGHPVLSAHYSIPRVCPLNTGFTVLCTYWDSHHFGGLFISNLSKILKFAGTHREITTKSKYQLICKNVC